MKRSIQYEIKLFLGMLLFMAILSVLVGCTESTIPKTESSVIANVTTENETLDNSDNIVKIRNCEYIKSKVYTGYVYTHCGDCSNARHYIFKQ